MKVELKTEGGKTYTVTDFELSGGIYYCRFNCLIASQMREKVNVTVYIENESGVYEKASGTLTYSVESYANGNVTNASLKPLLQAMMKYGDSAKAYVEADS